MNKHTSLLLCCTLLLSVSHNAHAGWWKEFKLKHPIYYKVKDFFGIKKTNNLTVQNFIDDCVMIEKEADPYCLKERAQIKHAQYRLKKAQERNQNIRKKNAKVINDFRKKEIKKKKRTNFITNKVTELRANRARKKVGNKAADLLIRESKLVQKQPKRLKAPTILGLQKQKNIKHYETNIAKAKAERVFNFHEKRCTNDDLNHLETTLMPNSTIDALFKVSQLLEAKNR